MSEPTADPLLERMFFARRMTLLAGAGLAGLVVFVYLADRICFLLPRLDFLWFLFPRLDFLVLMGAPVILIAIVVGSLFTWYYMFRVGLREAGVKYAVGHLLICMALTPVGVIFIPLLVYYDIDRWRQSAGE